VVAAVRKNVVLWTPEHSYLLPCTLTLNDVEARFGDVYVRVHRSYLVNARSVLLSAIDPVRFPSFVRVAGYPEQIPVARRRRPELCQRLVDLHGLWPVPRMDAVSAPPRASTGSRGRHPVQSALVRGQLRSRTVVDQECA